MTGTRKLIIVNSRLLTLALVLLMLTLCFSWYVGFVAYHKLMGIGLIKGKCKNG